MKVLNFLPFDICGSIQRRAFHVANELEERGVETVFVVPRGTREFSERSGSAGFRVYKTSVNRPLIPNSFHTFLLAIRFIIFFIKDVLESLWIIHLERPDVIHVTGFVSIQEGIAASLLHPEKTVWTLIGTAYPRLVVRAFCPLLLRVRHRIFVSGKMKGFYLSCPDDSVIYEPLVPSFLKYARLHLDEAKNLRKRIQTTASPILCSVGSINPAKGFEYLLRAFSFLKHDLDSAALLIVGGVPESQRAYYSRLLSERRDLDLEKDVFFMGPLPHYQIPALLSLVDLFVLASVSEGTPICVLEAMYMGVPVVATNVGGISSQIVNGINGYLVPPRDPEALSIAIASLWRNEAVRNQFIEEAKSHLQKVFLFNRCINEHERVYYLISDRN